jgi:hypothetical protein
MRQFVSSGPRPRCARAARATLVLTLLAFLAALAAAAPASAGPALAQTMVTPYAGINPCTGEAITGTGTEHFLLSENLSASGVIQSDLNVRLDGLQAVSDTGKKYVVQDTFEHDFVFGGADEESFDVVAHYVRVGEDGSFILGDDFYEYMRTHITANDNGVVTASKIDMNPMPCQ